MPMTRSFLVCAVLAIATVVTGSAAHAALTLTQDGINLGFTASTVVSGLPQVITEGPFGLALTGNGNILVSDLASATRYVFHDVDNQTLANALLTTPSLSGAAGYASGIGAAFGSDNRQFVRFNDNGTVAAPLVPSVLSNLGMAANTATGHLIATSSVGLIDIDPVANTFRVILPVAQLQIDADGVSLSPDGSVAYIGFFSSGRVKGYRVSDGAQVFDSGLIGHFPDGTGVIVSNNVLNGRIIVNGEDGNVLLLNPAGPPGNFVIIATNPGQRGDYVAPDRNNGSLLLDYSTEVSRLSCGPNCAIGTSPTPGPSVPEPVSSAALVAVGLGLLPLFRRSSRR